MQVSKSVGILLAAAGSLGHVAASQAQDLSIRPLPLTATQPASNNALALAVPVAATSNPVAPALPIQQLRTLTPGDTISAHPIVTAAQPAISDAAVPVIAPMWQINKADGTLQKLFARWAGQGGWSSLWEVDQDVPLVGVDTFSGSFPDAVKAVLRTTESTDTPLHPCFYTNKFLRVVPISTDCDPDQQ